jgi:hypothetical protein
MFAIPTNPPPLWYQVNLYPKQLAPITKTYLCPDGSCVEPWGKTIEADNAAIKAKLSQSQYSHRIIYYNIYTFMANLMHNKDHYGLTAQPV